MTSDPPVSFEQAAKSGGNPANGGYPYQIRGTDLDKNFVFASLVVADGLVDQTTGAGGHSARRLKIPNPPEEAEGLFLKADLSWSEPLEKGNFKGQFLRWDSSAKKWLRFSGSAEGAFPQWDAVNGWESQGAGTAAGQLLKWDAIAKNWVPGPSGTINNELLRWNATDETWEPFGRGVVDGQLLVAQSGGWVPFTAPPTSGTHVLGAVDGALQWIATEEC